MTQTKSYDVVYEPLLKAEEKGVEYLDTSEDNMAISDSDASEKRPMVIHLKSLSIFTKKKNRGNKYMKFWPKF